MRPGLSLPHLPNPPLTVPCPPRSGYLLAACLVSMATVLLSWVYVVRGAGPRDGPDRRTATKQAPGRSAPVRSDTLNTETWDAGKMLSCSSGRVHCYHQAFPRINIGHNRLCMKARHGNGDALFHALVYFFTYPSGKTVLLVRIALTASFSVDHFETNKI